VNLENSHEKAKLIFRKADEVLTAVRMKMGVFWVVVPCSLAEDYQCFRGTYYLHHNRPDDRDSKHL
jgi:hypothetical protein